MPKPFYGFPHETPYPVQIDLMAEIYNALQNRKIGFFESPTGTGKTLTLLCGALTWLSDQYSKNNHVENSSIESNEPEWLKRARSNGESTYNLSICEPSNKKIKLVNSKISLSLDNQIDTMLSILNDSEKTNLHDSFRTNLQNITPKIFYCSRTHSQLSQVVRELRKTSFFSDEHILNLATTSGSRTSLCINKSVTSSCKSSLSTNEACNDLLSSEQGCPYYNLKKIDAFNSHVKNLASTRILDIEDFLKSGSESQCCPYFSSRSLIFPASFIATPYNAILDKSTREAYNIDLTDNIVIFDEAHNIIDFIKQMSSVTISTPVLIFNRVVDCINEYIARYGRRLSGSNSSALSQLAIFFRKISEFEFNFGVKSYSINNFIYESKIDSFNFSQLLLYIEETKLFSKVFDETMLHLIPQIGKFIHALEVADCDGLFIISSEELKYICTNVVKIVSDVLQPCRAVIFCGGTLSPMSETISQLISPEIQNRVVSKSVSHVISPQNVNISLISTGPSGAKLNFSYESRFESKMITELGMIVLNYSKIIPAGMVVFFTSFSYMDYVLTIWNPTKIIENVSLCKRIFIEKAGESSESLLNEFEKTVHSSKAGAIIFAVMGGKLSEGINFADDLGRGIITIGLPYPNRNEIEVQEQIKAYVSHLRKLGTIKSEKQLESDYLESICMRTINQTIGRAFRHINDYASIIMIDERSTRSSIIDRLPNWISKSLTERSGKFSNSFQLVSQFFKRQSKCPGNS